MLYVLLRSEILLLLMPSISQISVSDIRCCNTLKICRNLAYTNYREILRNMLEIIIYAAI